MDPEKEAKLKGAAEALAYQVYGFLTAINTAAAGFDAGLRAVEQTHGCLPVALPALAGPKTEKKSRDPRRTRPALRPSGGSGTHQVPAPIAGLGSPTMLALLEDLNKELQGGGGGVEREADAGAAAPAAPRGPLVTPTVPEAATAVAAGRLSDAAPPTAPTPPGARDSTGSDGVGHMDSDEGEVRGSNEASDDADGKGDGGGGGGGAEEPVKADPDFSFDPAMVNSVRKSRRASPAPLTGAKAAKRSRRASPAAGAPGGEDFAFPTGPTAPEET